MEAIKDTVMNVMQRLADKQYLAGDHGPQEFLRKVLTRLALFAKNEVAEPPQFLLWGSS